MGMSGSRQFLQRSLQQGFGFDATTPLPTGSLRLARPLRRAPSVPPVTRCFWSRADWRWVHLGGSAAERAGVDRT